MCDSSPRGKGNSCFKDYCYHDFPNTEFSYFLTTDTRQYELLNYFFKNTSHMTFDLHLWPLTSWTCEGTYFISINQVWFQSDFNFSNEVNFTFWAHLTTWPLTTFDLDIWLLTIWRVPYFINKPSLVLIWLQLFKWDHFHIFSLSYNLTSDDLWPWYVTFDLINKWGFPCCIYDPTLVEIHQSMWKLAPNVNLFLPTTTVTTTGDKAIPLCLSC